MQRHDATFSLRLQFFFACLLSNQYASIGVPILVERLRIYAEEYREYIITPLRCSIYEFRRFILSRPLLFTFNYVNGFSLP